MANNDEYSIDNVINQFSTAIANAKVPEDGNTYKLLSIWADRLSDVQQRIEDIRAFNDLNNESGTVLNDEGRNAGVARNGDSDEFYRFRIKLKRLRRTSKGTLPFLYKLISQSLGCDPSEFSIKDMYGINGQANAIQIDDIPENYLDDSRKNQALLEGIQEAVAEGIKIISINYQTYVNMHEYVGTTAKIEHEYTVGARYRDLAYYTSAKDYAIGTAQVEHEYHVNNNRRDLAYPVNAKEHIAEAVQIEHEYNVRNQKRS